MSDRAVKAANEIGMDTVRLIGSKYSGVVEKVIERYDDTIERVYQLVQDGADGAAWALLRTSGLLDALADAVAAAGAQVNEAISMQRKRIVEVMEDDDCC